MEKKHMNPIDKYYTESSACRNRCLGSCCILTLMIPAVMSGTKCYQK